ncbi:Collectin-12, partial [Dissostichus eleginoides]
MKRLSQRPCFLLSSGPALTLNRSKSADDPCLPASHSRPPGKRGRRGRNGENGPPGTAGPKGEKRSPPKTAESQQSLGHKIWPGNAARPHSAPVTPPTHLKPTKPHTAAVFLTQF